MYIMVLLSLKNTKIVCKFTLSVYQLSDKEKIQHLLKDMSGMIFCLFIEYSL